MIKKMRRRLIGAAMAAFGAVILILLCAVNIWNYHMTTGQQDSMLEMLWRSDQRGAVPPGQEEPRMPDPWDRFSPEMRYMIRFFTVHCDANGRVLSIDQEHIASVSGERAAAYAEDIIRSGKRSGYYQNYRFFVGKTDRGITMVFLNAERELHSMRSLLLVSGLIALISVLAVFLLIVLFSKRAIAPYVRNIEAQKRFITDAGHELKTPLTAICASADVLAMEQEDNEWIKNIRSQSARMEKLIADLVTLSRLGEEQPFPEKTDFSLSEAAWEISEPMAALAGVEGKKYIQRIEDGITLHGDRNAVQRMLSILLDNAVKYSDEGGTIRLDVRKRQRKVQIVVCNSCKSVDELQIDRLFDRFYRPDVSRSKQTGGTGIGLAIARETAEAHGGRIRAESCRGQEIVFTVTL